VRVRPPFAQAWLRLRADGPVAFELKRAWYDGTRELRFKPAPGVPAMLGRNDAAAREQTADLPWRVGPTSPVARASRRIRPRRARAARLDRATAPGPEPHTREGQSAHLEPGGPHASGVRPIDVLVCPNCGGHLRLMATIHDPSVIQKILAVRGTGPSGLSSGPALPKPGAARVLRCRYVRYNDRANQTDAAVCESIAGAAQASGGKHPPVHRDGIV